MENLYLQSFPYTITTLNLQTRKGRITRTELRNVIEKFAFRLDNEQFKQLMLKLDPYHTNSISYHDFLKLFEETDTPVSRTPHTVSVWFVYSILLMVYEKILDIFPMNCSRTNFI